MSEDVKKINAYFKTAIKSDVELILDKIVLSERQSVIFDMFYIQKKDIGFIADTICVCQMVVNNELKTIRKKMLKSME